VLINEVLTALAIRPDGLYVDATFGRGGHSARILEVLGAGGRLIALDRDPAAIAAGHARFARESRLQLVHGEFGELTALVRAQAPGAQCNGVLFDFGVASPQLDDGARGFSFNKDGPIDMRMDPTRGQPVSAWLASASHDEIRHVIASLGEERFANRIATEIVHTRASAPLTRTTELAALISRCVGTREPGKHPATRTFQALRMHINDELAQIQRALSQTLALLASGGRLVAISFHSLEDRAVKQFISGHSQTDPALARLPLLPSQLAQPPLRRIGSKQRPTQAELDANPRARSAVLRVAERTAAAMVERK